MIINNYNQTKLKFYTLYRDQEENIALKALQLHCICDMATNKNFEKILQY